MRSPGVGSYAATAIDEGDLGKVALALVTTAVMVLTVNVVFWRPLVACSEKSKNERSDETAVPSRGPGALHARVGPGRGVDRHATERHPRCPTDRAALRLVPGQTGWQRWRRLLLPAIFPAYVTGAITASGGAWNAAIVAEVVTSAGTTLTATGLGAYIAIAADEGDFHHVLAGLTVMACYVVGLNRLVWQRLSRLAERRDAL
jgi:ABC-type anion transport system duplicated permease subunit